MTFLNAAASVARRPDPRTRLRLAAAVGRGSQQRRLLDQLEPRLLRSATVGTVDFTNTKQTIEGLGASAIQWTQPSEYTDPAFYDKLVNDLGVSAARAPAWESFEQENDNNDPNVFNWSKFDTSALAPAMQFDQRLKERGANEFFMSVWSPPYWMKTNHAIAGGGSLRYDMRAEFAEYCAALVISAQRDYGIHLAGISIQNEQFFVENYESGVMDANEMREIVIAVQQKFVREGLTTKVIANEDLGDQDANRWAWFNQPLLQDDEVDKGSLIIGSHSGTTTAMQNEAAQLAGTGVPLWYTEVSGKSPDWAGGLQSGAEMSDIFTKSGASSYYYYYFDTDPVAAYETPPYVGTASLMSNGQPNGKYYALKHFYKYVRPGMQRVATNIDETGGTHLSAFKDPKTGASTIVLVNTSGSSTDYTLDLSHLGKAANYDVYESTQDSYWNNLGKLTGTDSVSLTLPAYSIVTLHDGPEIAPIAGTAPALTPPQPLVDMTSGYAADQQLRSAAYNGDLNRLNQILVWGSFAINTPDAHGWTALDAAAASVYYQWGSANALACMNALIAAGANVNAVTDEGFTPMMIAAQNQFLEYGASESMKADMISALAAAGANVNAVDNQGRTALDWSALTVASENQNYYNTTVPMRLLALGADKSLTDAAGKTAYDYAMQEYKAPFVSLLAGNGLDTTAPAARYAKYLQNRNEVSLVLSENVAATLDVSDLQLTNRTTGAAVVGAGLFTMATPVFADGITSAHVLFNGRLPDGKYRLTIPAGTFADQSGVLSTQPITVDFTVLRGDVDGNGTVDFSDLLILAKNYGQSAATSPTGTAPLWSSGDFNGDGVVNFDDLLALAKNYGKTLA